MYRGNEELPPAERRVEGPQLSSKGGTSEMGDGSGYCSLNALIDDVLLIQAALSDACAEPKPSTARAGHADESDYRSDSSEGERHGHAPVRTTRAVEPSPDQLALR